jgi:hypothetical protein
VVAANKRGTPPQLRGRGTLADLGILRALLVQAEFLANHPENGWVDDAVGDGIQANPSQKLGADVCRHTLRASKKECHDGRFPKRTGERIGPVEKVGRRLR